MPRMHAHCQVILFLGPPGSGKGTQAARLSAALDIPAISTGDMLRRECQSGSSLGNAVRAILDSGRLVGDKLMNQVVANRLRHRDCESGCILDGYPRTLNQARFLSSLLADMGMPQPIVFDFDVSADEIIARLGKRRQCPTCARIYSVDGNPMHAPLRCEQDGSELVQRNDDQPGVIRERLRLHSEHSAQLIAYYRGSRYYRIPAGRSPEEITAELSRLVQSTWSAPVLAHAAAVPGPTGARI